MRRQRFVILGLGLLAASAVSIVVAHAQTTAVGPYYATPSWDQKIPCTGPSNCPRFVVLSNWNSEAILDRETGLVWERSPSALRRNWSDALGSCIRGVQAGNRKGWRLPTIQELGSLVEPGLGEGALSLPGGHPFDVQFDTYITATTNSSGANLAWGVDFSSGSSTGVSKTALFLVWCVRGGQAVDPQ